MNIYVGNVPYAATETDLEELFQEYGQVAKATIIRDRYDGRSKGFGFVEMENQETGERAIEALDGQEMMGRPLKVNPARPRGQRREPRHYERYEPQQLTASDRTDRNSSDTSNGKTFHNPYTFVPTPPRGHIERGKFAGDFNPLEHPCGREHNLDHASLKPNLWTGHIPIKLTTVTPLVLLKDDGRERDPKDDQIYDVHDRIPESSLRGMLRSAYEVVTNSRYSSFRNKDRLAYRMATSEANILIPTIIKEDPQTGKLKAHFYTGSSHPTNSGPRKTRKQRGQQLTLNEIKEGSMYTALLPRYNKSEITYQETNDEPKTGDNVYAEIVLCGSGSYLYWQTSRMWLKSDCKSKPGPGSVPNSWDESKLYKDSNGDHIIEVVEGAVLITNQNIDKKGNERVFFYHNTKKQQEKDITADHKKDWKALIKNYRDAHPDDDDIFNRKDMNGSPKKPWQVFKKNDDTPEYAWSPHLYHRENKVDRWDRKVEDALKLKDGDMVYARCEIDDKTGNINAVKDLFPVMISRELYENSPEDLLDESLQPANNLDELSAADRLFGWTPQSQVSDGGYKSRIRVVCEDGERSTILKSFKNNPLPLTILGTPKPEQGRFYVAADEDGTPQEGKSKQTAGYDKNGKKQLRGRKHYWHHKRLEAENDADYWNPSGKDRIREYIYSGDKPSQQNRSIKGWIKPQKEFKASLYTQNLQQTEVGALLWLLSRPEEHYFRLGYGKPLGFGSVKIEIDTDRLVNDCLPLGTGEHWKAYYAELDACLPAKLNASERNKCIQKFQDSMKKAYQEQNFDKLSFIKGLKQVLKGPDGDDPIHYPRRYPKPDPDGKNYEWFMDNENGRGRNQDGKKIALPKVTENKALPYNPSKPKPRRGGR